MKCPFCGSNRGYYQIERVHRALLFDFDGISIHTPAKGVTAILPNFRLYIL